MSNPLRLIRKFQKTLMVVFGSLLMVSFLLAGYVTTATNKSREDDGKRKVVSWEGGSITRHELTYLKMQHYWSQLLLDNLARIAQERKGSPQVNTMLVPVDQDPDQGDRDMMRVLMLARQAESLGMVVSDEAVLDFLSAACDREANEADFRAMVRELTGERSDLDRVIAQLKTELLAVNMFTLLTTGYSSAGQPVVTPVQSLAFETRQMRTAKAQLVEFKVEDFLSKVTDEPSRSEIKKLYEQGRFDFPDPLGERPGFRVPRQLSVEWISPDLTSDLLRPAPETITAEEIQARYDIWKEDPSSQAWEIVPAVQTNPTVGDNESSESGTNPEAGGDAGTGDAGTGDAGTGDAGTGDAGTGDAGTGDAGTGGDDAGDSGTGGATGDDGGAGGGNSGDGSTGNGDSQSALGQISDTQFVSFGRQDDEGQAVNNPLPGNAPRPTIQQPSTTPPEDTGNDAATNPITNLPESRLKPLEEVRDLIISELRDEKALEIAWDRIERDLESDLIENAADEIMDWEYDVREEDEDLPRPKGPNVKAWAEKHGFKYGSTGGLVDLATFGQTDFAQAPMGIDSDNIQAMMSLFQAFGQMPTLGMWIELQFDRLRPYSVERDPGSAKRFPTPLSGVLPSDETPTEIGPTPQYIYWLTEKKEPYSPELEECEDEVVRFWKLQKARELATAAATALAKKADSTEGFLNVDTNGKDVWLTDSFPWLAVGRGNLGQGSGQLSIAGIRYAPADASPTVIEPKKLVEAVGDDFMSDVFSMSQGDAGVTINASKKSVFAVFVEKTGGMRDNMLLTRVLERRVVDQNAMAVARAEETRYVQDWLRDLETEMEIKWLDP